MAGGGVANWCDGGTGDDDDSLLDYRGHDDHMLAGDGNDSLRGGLGDDLYVYRPGAGANLIDNSDGGVDWLIFTDDLTADRLSYYRDGDDLIVQVDDDALQQVTVSGWYAGSRLS